jgi:hypothetical protein
MSPKRKKYERLVKIIPERIKAVIPYSGMSQSDFAQNIIGKSAEHFNRTYKTGEIDEDWLNKICDKCDVSSDYLTGKINEQVSRFGEKRVKADGRKGLKEFVLSRGYDPNVIDLLSDNQLYDIEYIIAYMIKNPKESVLDNMADNIHDLMKRIKALEDNNNK